MKLGGQVGCVIMTNCFDFGEYPNSDSTTRKLLSDSSPLRDRAQLICRMISQKVVDGFRRNLGV